MRTRSRPAGDRRPDTNKVRQLERIVHSTVPEAPLNAPRRVGPERAAHFGLRAEVKWTEAGTTAFTYRGRLQCRDAARNREGGPVRCSVRLGPANSSPSGRAGCRGSRKSSG